LRRVSGAAAEFKALEAIALFIDHIPV